MLTLQEPAVQALLTPPRAESTSAQLSNGRRSVEEEGVSFVQNCCKPSRGPWNSHASI